MLAPALTIFLSSCLLFLVQPIIAKQILPWFGGSASVWTICLVFFQLVLLLGYAYAHWLTRHRVGSRYVALHIGLLLISCLALPIIPATFWKPDPETGPILRILGLLTATIGLPYFLLASTAPLLQHWLSGAAPSRVQERSIYRLFALSNFGSMVGLLSYPFAIEPYATVKVQAWVWSAAYVLFVISLTRFAWKRRRRHDGEGDQSAGGEQSVAPPSPKLYAYWIGCAALASVLLLAVTNQITQNIAAIPFLWIVPLNIYLLSFIICFEGRGGRGWYERRLWMTPAMLATGTVAWALSTVFANLSIYLALPIYLVGLFFGCVVCHGEIARSKPDPSYLTHFYLSVAAGGALGGMLVGLVAPRVFDSYWEMPLALIGLSALGVYICSQEPGLRPPRSWTANILVAALVTALMLLLLGELPSALDHYTQGWDKILKGNARWGCAALLVMSAFLLQRYRMARAVALTALLCSLVFDWTYYSTLSTGKQRMVRNFYGSLRVTDSTLGGEQIRRLMHGVILHGSEVIEPSQPETKTTYYGESSGIGRAILSEQTEGSLRIGSIGLGTGTLVSYGRSGDLFRIYELNPAVLDIAQHQFTFLKASNARVETVLGDARLSLEREIANGKFDSPDQRFNILSIDAFSGDAIPLHLLTKEAFATYVRVLKPDGVIAFHLSNQYLNLPPVVEQIARDAGFQSLLVADRPHSSVLTSPSDWVLVTRSREFLRGLGAQGCMTPILSHSTPTLWTDQFSNLLQVLK